MRRHFIFFDEAQSLTPEIMDRYNRIIYPPRRNKLSYILRRVIFPWLALIGILVLFYLLLGNMLMLAYDLAGWIDKLI